MVQSADCPSLSELAAFVRRQLPPRAIDRIGEHVSSCESCNQQVRGLSNNTAGATEEFPAADSSQLSNGVTRRVAVERDNVAADRPTPSRHDADTNSSTAADQPPVLRVLGQYELLERIGSGGMGVVYRARDRRLDRIVAVKVMSAGIHASETSRSRFEREGRAVARLKHSHVAPVHELGVHDGYPFLVMDYVPGGSLKDRLAEGRLPIDEAVRLVIALAHAVQAAHDAKVLHRDLKPSNVLLAEDGSPLLADFGLARFLDRDDHQTQTLSDEILGTPSYMAPEQAEGSSGNVGPAADVYGLGAILYELLTGQPPFRGATHIETLDLVRTSRPTPPGELCPSLAANLEKVCLKCLEKNPARRYASANELAGDLERFRAGLLPPARRPSWLGVALRRPTRLLLSLAALVAIAAVPLTAWSLAPERRIDRIERQLGHGKRVTLIGPTGRPEWSRWVLGAAGAREFQHSDGAFTLHADETSLLELVRDPQSSSYRFEMEVRHRFQGTGVSAAGLYFSRRDTSLPRGVVHSCWVITFNELDDHPAKALRVKAALGEKGIPLPVPPGNRVAFKHGLFGEAAGESPWCAMTSARPIAHFPRSPAGAWRRLTIVVRPDSVTASFDDQPPVTASAAKLNEPVARTMARQAVERADRTFVDRLSSPFSSRGSLGLYVEAGSASFRNVRIVPLPR